MRINRNILILVGMLLGNALGAQALEQLLGQVDSQNLEIQALRFEQLSVAEKAIQVSQLPQPELNLGAFVLPVETRLGPQWVRIGASQMFPWFGTLEAKRTLADLQTTAQAEQIDIAKLKNRYTLEQAFYKYYLLENSKGIIAQNQALLSALENLALTTIESGQGRMADVLQIQLKIKELAQQLDILENQKRIPLATINRVLNRPAYKELVLMDELELAILPFKKDSLLATPEFEQEKEM